MRSFCERLKSAPSFLYVGDSAFYERCVKEQVSFKWLSRVPERLNETKRWVEQPDGDFTWSSLGNGYKMTPLLDARYGDVSQRWVMIHSEKAATRDYKTLEKNIKKHKERLVNSGQKKYVDPLATTSGLVQKLEPLA